MITSSLQTNGHHPIGKKALRAANRRRVFNLRRSNAIETPLRQFKKLLAAKKPAEAKALMPALYKAFDKAAKTGPSRPIRPPVESRV